MPRKEITVTEEYQNIIENDFHEDLDFDPPQPVRFYISNIFQRTFARLIGFFGKIPKRIQCTSAGILKVAPTGTGFDDNDTKSGNAPDTYGSALVFDKICSRIDVWIWNNDAIIKRTKDGVTWDDEIEIPANTYYSFDCTTHSINIKNKTGGSIARYQIVGWY